ncbi:hypothetical protein ACFQLX_13590 [Streptomyces polyrhachis]|uniref:HEAT repeat domain-containing protein n=1 Tax=Streptomyces polyrhachis TaxID=1282885 RepID=A0ABW2GGX5_9ACTN
MPSIDEERQLAAVETLAAGFVTEQQGLDIAARHPMVTGSIARWIRETALAGDLRRAQRLANAAAALRAPGLGAVLQELLDADIPDLNNEDFVDILGDIGAADSVACILRVVERSLDRDAPAYWLTQKAISSLTDIGTEKALDHVRGMTEPMWPNVVRWHAAYALDIDEELGFDEDTMIG